MQEAVLGQAAEVHEAVCQYVNAYKRTLGPR